MAIFWVIAVYGTPFLAMGFCFSLVALLKALKDNRPTGKYTSWLTICFVLMTWSSIMVILDALNY